MMYKAYFCKIYGYLLKNFYYFYTNLNFQRPISHLILIWDPLKFYYFWTLQIKLSTFGRSIPLPKGWPVWQNCCVAELQAVYPPGMGRT